MMSSSTPTNTKLDIVLDTNQILSGFIFNGMSKLIFDLVLKDRLKLYISSTLKTEVLEKLQHFGIVKQVQNEIMNFLETKGILVQTIVKVIVCRDPEDNFVLELAETAEADYLVTRDRDLLDLPKNEWKNTKIVKPEEFLPYLRSLKLI